MKPSSINPRKKSRGRPKVDSDQVNARFERRLLDAIDAFASTQEPPSSRPEAVRTLVSEQLTTLGLLPHREDPEGAN